MKRKISLLIVGLMMFMGVVSASSINGDYQGMPIVKITSGERVLETDEVPAFIYEGHTVVPISTLRQLGASVTWDAYGYSVDVTLPQQTVQGSYPDLKKMSEELVNEVAYIDYAANSMGLTQLSFSLKFDVGGDGIEDKYQKVIKYGTESGVQQIRLVDQKPDGFIYFYKTDNIKDVLSGKITGEEFTNRIESYPKTGDLFTQNQNTADTGSYELNDALTELGVTGGAIPTVAMKDLAIELMELRKTKKQSDYSIQDALKDLGIPAGYTPTLDTLRQAIKLISLK